jgi:hypothetical protein
MVHILKNFKVSTILIFTFTLSLSAEDQSAQSVGNNNDTQTPDSSDVRSATVEAIDGTKIDMLVTGDGKAITVATQDPTMLHKNKKKKHHELNGNPVDEPLSIGLVNISTMSLVEDAQPEVSNPIP